VHGQALGASEEAVGMIRLAEGMVGSTVGSFSRSTLTNGKTWSLFALKEGDPINMDDAELLRAAKKPEYARELLQKDLLLARSDTSLEAYVREITGIEARAKSQAEVSRLRGQLPQLSVKAPGRVLKGFNSFPWRYELLEPRGFETEFDRTLHMSPFDPLKSAGYSNQWLVIEWADPAYPVSKIDAANVILVPHAAKMSKLELSQFRNIHESFLQELDFYRESNRWKTSAPISPDDVRTPVSSRLVIYTSVHNSDGSEILTHFHLIHSQLIGDARLVRGDDAGLVSGDLERQSTILLKELSQYSKGTDVLFYGDNLESIDLNSIADKAGLELLRRSPRGAVAGYRVNEPVAIANSNVQLNSLQIYGYREDLVDYLLRSGLISDRCGPRRASECGLPVLKLTSIPVPADLSLPSHGVKLLLNDPDDFVRIFDSLPQSQVEISQEIARGIQGGRKLRGETEAPADSGSGRNGEKAHACEREFKVCLAIDSASMVFGCEGIGEVEIATNGQISFSMPLGAKKVSGVPKE